MARRQPQKRKTVIREETQKERSSEKEKIAELRKKKREMEEELDELRGRTAEGKRKCVFAFAVTMLICFGALLGFIRMDAGNFASDVLAPLIADVPIVRNVLPKELQKKTEAEIAAEQVAAQPDTEAAAGTPTSAGTRPGTNAAAQSDTEAAAGTGAQPGTNATAQADTEAAAGTGAPTSAGMQPGTNAATQADTGAAAGTGTPTSAGAQPGTNTAVQADTEAAAQAEAEAALADYVDTYSQMKPKDAAGVFDNMMPDETDLVVKILENLSPDQRAAILAKMSVSNAAELTVRMEK